MRTCAVTMQPMGRWVGAETFTRKSGAQFEHRMSVVTSELEQELARAGVASAVLLLCVAAREIVRGTVRASARPWMPGVVLQFTHPTQGEVRFACDRYATWVANVRAITLTLEALRGVERWGAVQGSAQFAGFRALPGTTDTTMGVHAAVDVLQPYVVTRAPHPMTVAWLQEAARAARLATHPDRHGGDRTAWDQVEVALRTLGGGAG